MTITFVSVQEDIIRKTTLLRISATLLVTNYLRQRDHVLARVFLFVCLLATLRNKKLIRK